MAWVTTLGLDMAQIDYRLRRDAGCSLGPVPRQCDGHDHGQDAQVVYRLDAADRVETSGLRGRMTVHRTAQPVGGPAPARSHDLVEPGACRRAGRER